MEKQTLKEKDPGTNTEGERDRKKITAEDTIPDINVSYVNMDPTHLSLNGFRRTLLQLL